MATYGTDALSEPINGFTHQPALSEPSATVISERYDIMAGLPESYQHCSFSSLSNLKQLQNAVKDIYDQLEHNGWQGNQWLLILGMSQAAIDKLRNQPDCLSPIAFRFMWIGTTGLIKVVPGVAHDFTTSNVDHYINNHCVRMGLPDSALVWGHTVTSPGTVTTHGKQPDECFYPPGRQPSNNQLNGWPTLVIETGVSESLPKLRRDATWWFENSSGDTRIVLLVSIKVNTKQILFEKWQLAPPSLPTPVTRQALHQLRQQQNLVPPLVRQQAMNQTAFCHQEVLVTPAAITGGPLVIPFMAMFNAPPTGTQGDIIINQQAFRDFTRFV